MFNKSKPIFLVVGAISKGAINVDYTEKDVCISNYPLSAALTYVKVCSVFEEKRQSQRLCDLEHRKSQQSTMVGKSISIKKKESLLGAIGGTAMVCRNSFLQETGRTKKLATIPGILLVL